MGSVEHQDSHRVKFCSSCDTTLQWRATRCKACGAKQPKPPAPKAEEPEPAAVAWSGPPRTPGPGHPRDEIPSMPADAADMIPGAMAFAWGLSLLGMFVVAAAGPADGITHAGRLGWLAALAFTFTMTSLWFVIRSAIRAARRD